MELQELQAQLLIVKAKAYDDHQKAEATETAYKEALGKIAASLGYGADQPASVQQMCDTIRNVVQQLTIAQGELEYLRRELAEKQASEPVIDEAEFEEVN